MDLADRPRAHLAPRAPRRRLAPRRAAPARLAAVVLATLGVAACSSEPASSPDAMPDADSDVVTADTLDEPAWRPRWSSGCPGGPCEPVAPTAPTVACPDGWAVEAAGDATFCRPPTLPFDCPDGAYPGGVAECVPFDVPCGEPTEEELGRRAPGFDGRVWWVAPDGTGGAGGDGTRGAPFATVAEATAAATDGDIVVVAPGLYLERVVVDRRLAVLGCLGDDDSGETGPRVEIAAPTASNTNGAVELRADALVDGLRVSGESVGVWVECPAEAPCDVTLRRMDVDAARRVGVRIAGAGAAVRAEAIWVHDIRGSASDGSFGRGVQVNDGARLELLDATVQRVREVGLLAIGDGSELLATDVRVDGVLTGDDGTGSTGAEAFGARLELREAHISGVDDIGVSVAGEVVMTNVGVRLSGSGDERGALRVGAGGALIGENLWVQAPATALSMDGREGAAEIVGLVARGGVVAEENTALVLRGGLVDGVAARNAAAVDLEDVVAVCSLGVSPCVLVEFGARLDATRLNVEGDVFARASGALEGDDVRTSGVVFVDDATAAGGRWALGGLEVAGTSEVAVSDVAVQPSGERSVDVPAVQAGGVSVVLERAGVPSARVTDGECVLRDAILGEVTPEYGASVLAGGSLLLDRVQGAPGATIVVEGGELTARDVDPNIDIVR